jgi:ABC-type hemin transport system ATPase subunit
MAAAIADTFALLGAGGHVLASGTPEGTLTAAQLTRLYQTDVLVETVSGRLVILWTS